MTFYEKIAKQEKRYRSGLRGDFAVFLVLPVCCLMLFISELVQGEDIYDLLGALAGTVGGLILCGAIFLLARMTVKDARDPKTVEYDLDCMREELGLVDTEQFGEMLENMPRYEKAVFMDHRYLLDVRDVKVIPINTIVSVDKGSVHHRRSSSYFVWVIAEDAVKIRCRSKGSQEKLFNAVQLALMQNDQMAKSRRAVSEARYAKMQKSGDAAMDELKF